MLVLHAECGFQEVAKKLRHFGVPGHWNTILRKCRDQQLDCLEGCGRPELQYLTHQVVVREMRSLTRTWLRIPSLLVVSACVSSHLPALEQFSRLAVLGIGLIQGSLLSRPSFWRLPLLGVFESHS